MKTRDAAGKMLPQRLVVLFYIIKRQTDSLLSRSPRKTAIKIRVIVISKLARTEYFIKGILEIASHQTSHNKITSSIVLNLDQK